MSEAKVKVVVERGRTICAPDRKRKTFVGRNPDTNEPIYVPKLVDHTEGQEVEVSWEDAAFLRERGFAVDPNRTALPHGNGPTFGREQ
jgi:P pilus assembly chaperone PapD